MRSPAALVAPSRARGLKPARQTAGQYPAARRAFTGAWVETFTLQGDGAARLASRLHGRVG